MPDTIEQLKDIKSQLTEQGKKLNDIHLTIVGNEEYGIKGIKHKLEDHEERIDTIEEKTRNGLWKTVASIGTGAAIGAGTTTVAKTGLFAKMIAFVLMR